MWHNKLELTRPRLRTKPEHLKHMCTIRQQPKPDMFDMKCRLFLNSSNTKPSRERERERQRERERETERERESELFWRAPIAESKS